MMINRRQAAGLVCLFILVGLHLPGAPILRAEGFDSGQAASGWTFGNGPEFPGAAGSLEWKSGEGRGRPGCLALHYSFVKGGNYVEVTAPVPAGPECRQVRLWLKEAGDNRVTFRAVDDAGQCFQKSLQYVVADWQEIEVDLDRWDHSWGGAHDGQIRGPWRRFGVLVENSGNAREGTLLVDDVEFLTTSSGAADEVTYPALDFSGPVPLSAAGGPGNRLEKGIWRYQFNDGDRPGLMTDFSLLGAPARLRLVVEGDGSGHAVRVELGSHFQFFFREIGKLTAKGEQALEVPLGDLKGWGHDGGENDGTARPPLRLRGIRLEPGAGPRSGALTLKRLEIVTRPRDGQLVVLVPDASRQGNDIRFSVRAINLRSTAVRGTLTCDVRELGASLQRPRTSLELDAHAGSRTWDVTVPAGDRRFVEAMFHWSDEAFTSKPVNIGTSAVPDDPGSADLEPDSFVGAGLYLYRYQGSPNYAESIRAACRLARRAGVKWTREEIQWHATEPAEGSFNFKFYDDLVEIARSEGISVYGLLAYWAPWARINTPEGARQYARWAATVVRHYQGRIRYWEIWNEPNIFFWSGPKELYAELLTQAYDAIKSADPDAVVLGCSTAGVDTGFIRKVMGWGGKFDALTIHPYRGVMNDLGFMQELMDVRDLVNGRDVWLTEIGFPSQLIDGWSERRQASLAARVYLCTAASGAGRSVSWYDFRNDGNDAFYNEANFGLVRSDLRPKPAYGALAAASRLGRMRLAGKVEVGPDAYAFRFSGGSRDVVAACAPDKSRLLAFKAAAPRVTNTFGETVHPLSEGGITTLALEAGFPVYIEGPAAFGFECVPAPVDYGLAAGGARAGGEVTFTIKSAERLEAVRWDLPPGWPEPRTAGPDAWRILVPRHAPAYDFDIQAVIRTPAGELRLPARLSVAPAKLRV
jgi:hypothetical protein